LIGSSTNQQINNSTTQQLNNSTTQQLNNSTTQQLNIFDMLSIYTDEYYMKEALKEAQKAYDADEVPVGAVVVCNKQIIARAHNLTERLCDVTAHAEMQAITAAANAIGGKYLNECTVYVTLEPCPMCAGALYWAQIGKLVYAANDEKKGYTLISDLLLHPKTNVHKGIMAEASTELMQRFFRERRKT
jgi:tRNA(adenine34) deaminase